MTFFLNKVSINRTYYFNKTPLKFSDNSINDLGFTLTRNLCPNMHIQTICCKAIKLLGLMFRISADFHLLTSLNNLFRSLVHPILEYNSMLWDPPSTASVHIINKRVQRKCLRQAGDALLNGVNLWVSLLILTDAY